MKKRGKEEAICRERIIGFPSWFTIKKTRIIIIVLIITSRTKEQRQRAADLLWQMPKGMG